jgi:methionine-rich copper-binding protein CopC
MRSLISALAATIVIVAPAAAQPRLVAATPAANATVKPTAKVQLSFSERLVARLSTAQVVMTGMPGMADHPPMPIQSRAAIGPDGKSLVLTFARPLVPGTYKVTYKVASADTQRIEGSYEFKVR